MAGEIKVDTSFYLTKEDFKKAEENNITYMQAYNRFYNGHWTKSDALTKPVKKIPRVWSAHKEVALANGISRQLFTNRMLRGFTPVDAATEPIHSKSGKRRRREQVEKTGGERK